MFDNLSFFNTKKLINYHKIHFQFGSQLSTVLETKCTSNLKRMYFFDNLSAFTAIKVINYHSDNHTHTLPLSLYNTSYCKAVRVILLDETEVWMLS